MITESVLKGLKDFVALYQANPDIINAPELSFFKTYLVSLGSKLPASKSSTAKSDEDDGGNFNINKEEEIDPALLSEDSDESILDFGDLKIMEEESEPFPDIIDIDVEVDDESREKANEKVSDAMSLMSNKQLKEAVAMFTEAIKLCPTSSMMYGKRAQCLLKMNRPSAAIRDCDIATKMNPDSALPYRIRGLAKKLLGKWEESYKDLQMSCKLDFNEEANAALKEVEPMHKKILEHNLKYDRIRRENKIKRAKRAHAKAKSAAAQQPSADNFSMPNFSMPGMGGMPPGAGNINFGAMMSDPEVMMAMQDPEMMQVFQDCMTNPANLSKYADNPKVQRIMEKVKNLVGGGGGGAGGPGGMGGPGFPPRGSGGAPPPSKPSAGPGPTADDLD